MISKCLSFNLLTTLIPQLFERELFEDERQQALQNRISKRISKELLGP